MPSFAYSFVGCLNWSCISGQCQNDPVVWGACCTYVSEDPEEEGFPRPSCGAQPYCEQYPSRCIEDHGPYPGIAAAWCFHAHPAEFCSDPNYTGNPNLPNRCNIPIIDDFPECFPTSGSN